MGVGGLPWTGRSISGVHGRSPARHRDAEDDLAGPLGAPLPAIAKGWPSEGQSAAHGQRDVLYPFWPNRHGGWNERGPTEWPGPW